MTKAGVKPIEENERKKLVQAGLSEDEIKLLESWRFIEWGNLTAYKKEGKLSGAIKIEATYK